MPSCARTPKRTACSSTSSRRATAPEIVLRLMNQTGVLGRFIPEFGRIVALMQFNMYHHYTVDEHLLRASATWRRSKPRRSRRNTRSSTRSCRRSVAPRALSRAVPARRRQGPRARTIRSPARRWRTRSAPRSGSRRRSRARVLADRASSRHVGHGAAPRPQRPAHDRDLRRDGAVPSSGCSLLRS